MTRYFDVMIVGGGMVGLTLACALGQQGFSVALIESNEPNDIKVDDDYDLRVSAINKSSQQVFENINVWQKILGRRGNAYQHMHVWDAQGDGEIHFDAAELGVDALGHIIENKVIQYSLYEQCKAIPTIEIFCPQKVSQIHYDEKISQVVLENGDVVSSHLLIGADGANSRVRAAAGIDINTGDYQQKGVVCVVRPSHHHQDTAWQRFLPAGPLAFLPLSNGECSIVWSADNQKADELLSMNDERFRRELELAFDSALGKIESVGKRAAFPLVRRHADEYVKKGLALIGDAAHTIHPLAGQGVNLGILDAAALTEVLVKARAQGHVIYSLNTLKKYQRWRRGDNSLMMYSMSGFKNLFSNEHSTVSFVRNVGLNLVNDLGPVKHKLMRHALGLEGDLPKMARPVGW